MGVADKGSLRVVVVVVLVEGILQRRVGVVLMGSPVAVEQHTQSLILT